LGRPGREAQAGEAKGFSIVFGALTIAKLPSQSEGKKADWQQRNTTRREFASERLRMVRECMGMHHKHVGDSPFHSGGNERLYRACMANHGHHG
jgi:hypothetical protein